MATNVANAVLLASPVLRDMDITEEDAHQKVPEALKKGLEPRELDYSGGLTDEHLKYCSRLEILHTHHNVELTIDETCGVENEVLNVWSDKITRCPLSVKCLFVANGGSIGSDGILHHRRNIKHLPKPQTNYCGRLS